MNAVPPRTNFEQRPRIRKFRELVVRVIPRIPNNRDTLVEMERLSLATILIHYASWASRYVAIRPRRVEIEPTVMRDSRWMQLRPAIDEFFEKVRNGNELTAHLSLDPHTRGYAPFAAAAGDRWKDKDFLLNVMGYHHFHLGTKTEQRGHIARTDEVLFAKVLRDSFTAIAIFDHSVFHSIDSASGKLPPERERLWSIFEQHAAKGMPPGSVYMPAAIATSGHPLRIVQFAQRYTQIVRELDLKLDDREYVRQMYEGSALVCPERPRLSWRFDLMDLGILDDASQNFFVVQYGPN